jgi:hypothetical protein
LAAGAFSAVLVAALAITWLAPRPSSAPAGGNVTDEARNGDFVLTVAADKARWMSNEAIAVSARLTYEGGAATMVSGSAAPVSIYLVRLSTPSPDYTTAIPAPFVCEVIDSSYERADEWTAPGVGLPPGRWRAVASADFRRHASGADSNCQDGERVNLTAAIEFDVVEAIPSNSASPSASVVGHAKAVSLSSPGPIAEAAMEACNVSSWLDGLTGMALLPVEEVVMYVPLTGREPELNETTDSEVWIFEFQWPMDLAPILPTRGVPFTMKTDHLVCMYAGGRSSDFIVGGTTTVGSDGTVIETPSPVGSPALALPTPAP